ncbi:hypothetical protein E8E11_004622 [Didymella keratinophila]|nr:hypothetical protein E8E11_004622 [Didymella keratinophila]
MAGVISREEEYRPMSNVQKRYLDLLHKAEAVGHEEVEEKRAELLAMLTIHKSGCRGIRIKVKMEIMREIKAEEQAKAIAGQAAEDHEEAIEEDEEAIWEDEEAIEGFDEEVDNSEACAR